ncbi:ATP synthase mitochondrial F1 complex assembly factor 2 [Lepeophtheirus salmonis]|uniref:ATP synthase mitochondrial F1 complex assembly factor 2 n=1 Tax=Lepeophtheirus salmonis TaxID=72036 RepID=UPI001AE58115|nr:ATP synthase mitochondrial F1 complex assembly factor 2-like [Lepeophtheirus salmonis]
MKRLLNFSRRITPLLEVKRGVSAAKRFYKDVNVVTCGGSNFEISLDSRKLKTPSGKVFTVVSEPLAHAVAVEWASQKKEIIRSQMHLTGLVSTCIDNPTQISKEDIITEILEFLKTDTLLFFASEPTGLTQLQEEKWRPIIDWFNNCYGVSLSPTNGQNIHGIPNVSNMDVMKVRKHLTSYPFEAIHGLRFGVDAVKSLIIALSVLEKRVSIDQAIGLARLELEYQTSHWGNVEWAHDIELHDSTSRLAASAIFVNLHVNSYSSKNKELF